MNIAIISSNFGHSGHSRDAVAIARGLRERGHNVTFVVGKQSNPDLVVKDKFCYKHADSEGEIYQIISGDGLEYEIDVANIFSNIKMGLAAKAAFKARKPAILTQCGGSPSKVIPPIPIICTSGELRDDLKSRHSLGEQYVHHVASRFDTFRMSRRIEEHEAFDIDEWLHERYDIKDRGLLVVRVARISEAYKRSIIEAARAVCELNRNGIRATLVHVGGGSEDSQAWMDIDTSIAEANKHHQVPIAISVRHEPSLALPLIAASDVVVGTGLTALEAMYFGKPVFVVGKRGFAGTVDEDSISQIEHYNFSGRNVGNNLAMKESISSLVKAINQVAQGSKDNFDRERFYNNYLDRMSYKKGAIEYEDVYQNYLGQVFQLSLPYQIKGRIKDFLLNVKPIRRMIWRMSSTR